MSSEPIIAGLRGFQQRLKTEVLSAFQQRGGSFGNDRFRSWRRQFSKFLDTHLPRESSVLNEKLTHIAFVVRHGESDSERFWREDGEAMDSYIESLVIDLQNGEYELPSEISTPSGEDATNNQERDLNSIFIVHGHDGEAKQKTARFIEKLGFNVVILSEQPSRSRTIIEKIEQYSCVGFAIVLYTADDVGGSKLDARDTLRPRARQNVIFEHGYLMARIGRANVVALVEGGVELPSDIGGIVYISDQEWQLEVAKEMKAAGYKVDFNRLL